MTNQTSRLQELVERYPAKIRSMTRGTYIARPDDTPSCMLYIVRGKVRQFDTRINGSEVTLNIYGKGALIALPWLLQKEPNTYFFQTLEDTTVKEIPFSTATDWFQSDPMLSFQTLSRLVSGFDGMYSRLLTHSGNDAIERIKIELGIESRRFGVTRQDGLFIKIKSIELATRTGLARETTSRALSSLAKEGYLSKVVGGYILHKP